MTDDLLRTLIRVDGAAALVSAIAVFGWRDWISTWSGWPLPVLATMSGGSPVYAAYSLTLSSRAVIPPGLVRADLWQFVVGADLRGVIWSFEPSPLGRLYVGSKAMSWAD